MSRIDELLTVIAMTVRDDGGLGSVVEELRGLVTLKEQILTHGRDNWTMKAVEHCHRADRAEEEARGLAARVRSLCGQVKDLEQQKADLTDHARNLEGQLDGLWGRTLKAAEDRKRSYEELTARARMAEGRVADLEGAVHDLESALSDAMRRATDAEWAEAELVMLRDILIDKGSGQDSGPLAEDILKELAGGSDSGRRWVVRMNTSDIGNHKITVVRAIRVTTRPDGMGLKEAKDLVDGLLTGDTDKMVTIPIQLSSANAVEFLGILEESGINLDMVGLDISLVVT